MKFAILFCVEYISNMSQGTEVSAADRTLEAPGAHGEEAALATGRHTEGDATLLHGHHQSHPGHSRSPCQAETSEDRSDGAQTRHITSQTAGCQQGEPACQDATVRGLFCES